MKKWKKALLWIVSIAAVFVVAAYFAMNYATDRILETMISREEGIGKIGKETTNGFSKEVVNEASSQDREANNLTSAVTPGKEEKADDSSSSKEVVQAAPSPDKGSDSPDSAFAPATAGGPNKQASAAPSAKTKEPSGPSPAAGTSKYKAEISASKAEEVQEQISLSDKLKVLSTLSNKLSTSDIKLLNGLMNGGGLSIEKKREAKKIIMKKLSEKEYDELISIASKYGVSKGKNYKDSLQEK